MNFNIFPKKKSIDEIIETDKILYDSFKKEANDLASGVVNGVYELQHQLDENVKLKEENKNLEDILKSIEEDGTTEHNNAINLRESVAHLRKEAEKFYNENIQLTKEVIHLRHLKTENVELIERLQKEGKSYGINFNEAKTQIIQNDYKKCAEEREEYKHQLNAANKEIEALKLMYEERETKLKTYNRSLQCQIVSLKEEKETQKHPMYPLHWGGYDGAASAYPEQYSKWLNEQKDKAIKEKYDKNIIDFVESEFSNEDPLEGKQVEFNAEELLKRVTEYADTLNDLPKSFPNEFQDDKTTAENLEERFNEGKDVLDYFEKPWKCPCNKCKESKNEKSWEEVASDLALKVAKLERMIEELKVVKANRDPNYDYFMKNGKWPWHNVKNNS
jgi:hypothetical protein